MLKFCRVYFYTSNSSLLTVFSFRYIKKPITYHVAFSILPLAKLVEGVSGIGGLSDCGMVFSLANKNARESA